MTIFFKSYFVNLGACLFNHISLFHKNLWKVHILKRFFYILFYKHFVVWKEKPVIAL